MPASYLPAHAERFHCARKIARAIVCNTIFLYKSTGSLISQRIRFVAWMCRAIHFRDSEVKSVQASLTSQTDQGYCACRTSGGIGMWSKTAVKSVLGKFNVNLRYPLNQLDDYLQISLLIAYRTGNLGTIFSPGNLGDYGGTERALCVYLEEIEVRYRQQSWQHGKILVLVAILALEAAQS